MDIKEYTKQNAFLKKEDITSKPDAEWVIIEEGSFVRNERFDKMDLNIPISCGDEEKLFSVSKTNARFISDRTNLTDTRKWIGKKIKFEVVKLLDGKDSIMIIDIK